MQKLELAKVVAKKCNISQAKAKEVIDCITGEIRDTVADGTNVTIQGFGSWRRETKNEREITAFEKTNYVVPKHYTVRFKAGAPFKAALEAKLIAETATESKK